MSGTVTNLEEARAALAEAQRKADGHKMWGSFWDWSEDDERHLLEELSDGFYQHDKRSLLGHVGCLLALGVLVKPYAEHPAAALNAVYWISGMLCNLYGDELSEAQREIVSKVMALTNGY